jgi:2TM domain
MLSPKRVPAPVDHSPDAPERERARRRLEARRKFRGDIAAWVVINAVLVIIWLATDRGDFWPAWVMGIWGAFLLLQGWDVYLRRPITDADVEAELRRRA